MVFYRKLQFRTIFDIFNNDSEIRETLNNRTIYELIHNEMTKTEIIISENDSLNKYKILRPHQIGSKSNFFDIIFI